MNENRGVARPDAQRTAASKLNLAQDWPELRVPLEKHSLYRKVDRLLGRLTPGRVIEIGCADGRFLEVLRQRGWSVVGAELQGQEHEYIRQLDASEPLPFGPEFDVVLAVEVIEHMADTSSFLANCAAILKPGGILILTTPNLLFGVNRLLMLAGKQPRIAYADFHLHMFVWDDLRSKLDEHFAVVERRGSHVLLGVRRSRLFVVFERLGDWFPTLAAHFVVVARKRDPA